MPVLLIPADGELAAITALDQGLAGTPFADAPAATQIPDSPKPARFVRVVSAGGSQRDLVTDEATLVVDAFAVDEVDARDLAAYCVAVLQRAGWVGRLGDVVCYGVDVGGIPANLPHPDVPDRYRYTVTATAALRRAAA